MSSYHNLSIRILPPSKNGEGHDVYPVYITLPNGHEPPPRELTFTNIDPAQYRDILSKLGPYSKVRDVARAQSAPPPENGVDVKSLGTDLFDALFGTQELHEALALSMQEAKSKDDKLRIRLMMDLHDAKLAHIACLPWEFLIDNRTKTPLLLSGDMTLVRYLAVEKPADVKEIGDSIRILFVSANPYPPGANGHLELEKEIAAIRNALGFDESTQTVQKEGFEITELANATYDALKQKLIVDDDFDVIHFMGHGEYDGKEGYLLFEKEGADDSDPSDKVSGERLSTLLAAEPTQLFVINACNTARTGDAAVADPYAGVASSLVRNGLPAVIAMQFEISDNAAIKFSNTFYSVLARSRSIEDALMAGRRMLDEEKDFPEWGTPVLFMQATADLLQPKQQEEAQQAKYTDFPNLHYTVDREKIISQLRRACKRVYRTTPKKPIVCFVPANDRQCFLELKVRFDEPETKIDIFNPATEIGIGAYRISWPDEYFDAEDFEEELIQSLGENLPRRPRPIDFDSVQKGLLSIKAPILIYTEVPPNFWNEDYPENLLEEMVAFWAKMWDSQKVSDDQRLLLLIGLTYPFGDENSMERSERAAHKLAMQHIAFAEKNLNQELKSDQIAQSDKPYFSMVLNSLGNVSKDEARQWASENKAPVLSDLVTPIEVFYDKPEYDDGIEMRTVADHLKKLLMEKFPA